MALKESSLTQSHTQPTTISLTALRLILAPSAYSIERSRAPRSQQAPLTGMPPMRPRLSAELCSDPDQADSS